MRLSDYPSSDAKGLRQCATVLAVGVVTGTGVFLALRHGQLWLVLAALMIHGNICSLWISATHELAHGTVFASKRLNSIFIAVFEVLNWQESKHYFNTHRTHHANTLGHDDLELAGTCRPLWIGTWVWAFTFNLPKFVGSVRASQFWSLVFHGLSGCIFGALGFWEWVPLVSLAPFYGGVLELLVNYPQHAAMQVGATDLRHSTRSISLPGWLSVLNWRMEHHLTHHLHPSVPCYWLPKLSRDIASDLPSPQTIWQAWRDILRKRKRSECGFGPNPVQRLLEK